MARPEGQLPRHWVQYQIDSRDGFDLIDVSRCRYWQLMLELPSP
jgi:hypothetical protein